MKLKITNHFGMYQFWHMDCGKGRHESPMSAPIELDDGIKQFKCLSCNRVGQVTLPVITTGDGELEEISA